MPDEVPQITVVNTGGVTNLAVFSEGDDFEIFEERLEQHLLANSIPEDRKVAVLLTLVSVNVYKILKNLCHPLKPKEKNYQQLIDLLSSQFKKRVSVFRRRLHFNLLAQGQETVNQWYVRVKTVASECQFDGIMLAERVKDKFVVGLRPGPILDRLCEENPNKDLKDLLDIALNKEAALLEADRNIEVNKVVKNKDGEKSANESGHSSQGKEELTCNFCGRTNHVFKICKYRKFICKKCNKKGHIAAACTTGAVEKNFYFEASDEPLQLFNVADCENVNYIQPLKVNALICKVPIEMELDTGAGVSCVPFCIYKQKLNFIKIRPCTIKLKTYAGNVVKPEGEILVDIEIKNVLRKCRLVVVKGASKVLLGRDILNYFNISFKNSEIMVNKISVANIDSEISKLISKFSNVFKNELGTYVGEKIKLKIKNEVRPIFHKPVPVPFAFREKVVEELKRLENQGVIRKVENSQWGTPLVPVLKSNNKDVRVCANYKITINKYLEDFNHPLPRIDEIFVALQGGQTFTKLDFLNAYNQLVLDEDTSNLLSWSTPYGIFKVLRLPYGTKPACSIFQSIVEKVLQGCKGTVNFLDDVVVTGKDNNEHLQNLEEVLNRLDKAGFRLNIKKCEFFKKSIYYLGHKISEQGLEPDKEKVRAIIDTPRPKNITEVRAFTGLVNYYAKFIKNLSGKLKPLYDLTSKGREFCWNRECEEAFQWAKTELVSDRILIHFNSNKPIRLACDSSQYGIGAVLLHVMPDGAERPICYISRVLTKAEKNYSMIMKEALAIYWSVSKLYQYLAGRKFEILSDHKPLEALFGEYKSLPKMAAGRIQRWSIFLANFNYSFKYIKGVENVKADALSRLPLADNHIVELNLENESNFDYLNFVEDLIPVDVYRIRSETRRDPILGTVFNFIRYGFPEKSENVLFRPFLLRKHELSVENGVILWGYRVVIPTKLRENLLKELHSTHEGIVKMKTNARSYFWWPSLDSDIENQVNSCKICMQSKPEPNKAQLIPTSSGKYFYERVHADFLGPFNGKMILIIVDSFSKWPEAFILGKTDAETTIEKFRECFSRFGLPRVVVTDNGAQFVSEEFSQFLSNNGIKHLTSPPFHPATNGFAENAVKSFKQGIKKCLMDVINQHVSFQTIVNRYLFHYRNSVHITTGCTPSSLIFKHHIRTRFDLLSVYNKVDSSLDKQIENYRGKREEIFEIGDRVWCRDYRNPNKKRWVECIIDETLGNRLYFCKLVHEQIVWKRHLNQIIRDKGLSDELQDHSIESQLKVNDHLAQMRSGLENVNLPETHVNLPETDVNLPLTDVNVPKVDLPVDGNCFRNKIFLCKDSVSSDNVSSPETSRMNVLDRPKRNIKPPQRLNL